MATTITLRNLPPELLKRLRRKAESEGLSLSKTVVELLEQSLGVRRARGAPRLHRDLDGLFGCWSDEEAAAFESALAEQRQIDEDAW